MNDMGKNVNYKLREVCSNKISTKLTTFLINKSEYIYSSFIDNMVDQMKFHKNMDVINTCGDAFSWKDTLQGYRYWSDLNNDFYKSKIDDAPKNEDKPFVNKMYKRIASKMDNNLIAFLHEKGVLHAFLYYTAKSDRDVPDITLMNAFDWAHSEEGHLFWGGLYKQYPEWKKTNIVPSDKLDDNIYYTKRTTGGIWEHVDDDEHKPLTITHEPSDIFKYWYEEVGGRPSDIVPKFNKGNRKLLLIK